MADLEEGVPAPNPPLSQQKQQQEHIGQQE